MIFCLYPLHAYYRCEIEVAEIDSYIHFVTAYFFKFDFLERGRDRNINLLLHLFMHSLVDYFLKDFIFRGGEGEDGRKRGRETSISCL